MEEDEIAADAGARGRRAEAVLDQLFSDAGWKVHRQSNDSGDTGADMMIRKKNIAYVVQVKTAAEGRNDRLIPLWAQACLQAMHAASSNRPPMAVLAAPRITQRAAEQVLEFASRYAPEAAAGVIDFQGLRCFRGPHLEGLDAPGADPQRAPWVRTDPANLFSDLNQWMLKVLLAPELPERLLAAPRGRYRNASQLARAANVSVMSAFRLVQQLQRDGYLHESGPYLKLVRREELFRSWQAASTGRVKEVPMRFLLGGEPRAELRRMARSNRACLALFAAAEALHLGFVHGVPPYVYVDRLGAASVAAWKRLVPAERHEVPDIILRQAPAPQSVFRGLVWTDEIPVCDILQVWLDVSSHPSRGKEQADLIRRRALDSVIEGAHADG